MNTSPPAVKHLYVHIPFCRSRCAYCDFSSEPVGPHLRAGRVERYLGALRAELAARSSVLAIPVGTIFVGGGTPTVLPPVALEELIRDLAALQRSALPAGPAEARPPGPPAPPTPTPAPEFTVEANPGTLDRALLERLAEAGATRLSLGVQSFAPAFRAVLGRRVSQAELLASLEAIAASGWREWNIDLVFGIPGQTWPDVTSDLDAAVAAGPTHISLYDLTYTRAFRSRVEAAAGSRAHSAACAFAEEHYSRAVERLLAAGYGRYEVSNFAQTGHECLHNQAYWRGEDYLGIGAAAVSTVAGERSTNPLPVAAYLAGRPPEVELLSPRTRRWERAMLGLRTADGVDEAAILPVLDQGARDRLLAQGCLERRCGRLRLNPGFLDVSNAVILALLVPSEELRSSV